MPKGTGGSNPPPSVLLCACASQDQILVPAKQGPQRVLRVSYRESFCTRQRYVGLTDDLQQRLQEHNEGKSSYTSKSTPWKLTTYIAFTNRQKAEAFERYLKSGSCICPQAPLVTWSSRCYSLTFLDHLQFLAQLDPAAMRQDAAEIYAGVNHAIAADNRAGIDHRIAADLGSIADDCAEFS